MGQLPLPGRSFLLEAEQAHQPDGRARAVDGSGLQGGPQSVKLLVLPLLGNSALKLPGVLSVGELPSTGPLGKEPSGERNKVPQGNCAALHLALATGYTDSST